MSKTRDRNQKKAKRRGLMTFVTYSDGSVKCFENPGPPWAPDKIAILYKRKITDGKNP